MPGRPSDKTVDRDGWYLWVLSMELAACGVHDFAVALDFRKLFGSLYSVAYRGGGGRGSTPPPPEIRKALRNRAKLNPIVKTAKNC